MDKQAQDLWSEDVAEMDVPRMVYIAREHLGHVVGRNPVPEGSGTGVVVKGAAIDIQTHSFMVFEPTWYSDEGALRHALIEVAARARKLNAGRDKIWLGSEKLEDQ